VSVSVSASWVLTSADYSPCFEGAMSMSMSVSVSVSVPVSVPVSVSASWV
jgi:hypothetical protein